MVVYANRAEDPTDKIESSGVFKAINPCFCAVCMYLENLLQPPQFPQMLMLHILFVMTLSAWQGLKCHQMNDEWNE